MNVNNREADRDYLKKLLLESNNMGELRDALMLHPDWTVALVGAILSDVKLSLSPEMILIGRMTDGQNIQSEFNVDNWFHKIYSKNGIKR